MTQAYCVKCRKKVDISLLHGARFAAHDDHFQAVVVVQMHVESGKDGPVILVLEVHQFVAQHPDVVVVDQGDRAYDAGFRGFRHFLDEFVAYEVTERFRTVGIPALLDVPVELFQEIGIDGYANPAEFAHAYSIVARGGLGPPGGVVLVPPLATAGTGFVARFDRSCYGGYENVHIPDGFLATPVWATLDAVAAPTVVYVARRAQRGFEESQAPLLGVMGAFVFAAQMINFPVGVGTSGHLVGGALLAYTLGPAAAAVVMTAILAIQALVFQDGGLLALGPNIVNMAVCVGTRFRGARGAIAAFSGLLCLPFAIILVLGALFTQYGELPAISAAFRGISAAAAGLIVAMGLKMAASRRLRSPMAVFALAAFVGIALVRLPLGVFLLAAAPASVAAAAWRAR